MLRKLFYLIVMLSPIMAMTSCDDDNDVVIVRTTPPLWGTVHTTEDGFYIECDAVGTVLPERTSTIEDYDATDGQRVITSFVPLEKDFEGYNYKGDIAALSNILTKKVEPWSDNPDYGNDPVLIYKGNLWIGGGYLNIIFSQNLPLGDTKHRISLLRSDQQNEDGYIELELRYNDYDDLSGRRARSAVSFDLSSFDITSDTKGIILNLNSEVNGNVNVKINFSAESESPDDACLESSVESFLE